MIFPVSKEKYNALLAQKEALDAQVADLTAQLAQLQADLDQASRANDHSEEARLFAQLEAANTSIDDLTSLIAQHTQTITLLNAKITASAARIAELQTTINNLNESAVEATAIAAAATDSNEDENPAAFFDSNIENMSACVHKIREYGL